MGCLKCGKETEEKQVFCSECSQIMEQYPVKPGTLVQLPQRASTPQDRKPSRRRSPTAEETNEQLRIVIRWLLGAVAVLALLICLLAGALLHTLGHIDREDNTESIGRNYTTAEQPQQES